MDLIGNAVHGGHKVLLFSQFTTMLDRLAEQLKKLGIDYYMLTGSCLLYTSPSPRDA